MIDRQKLETVLGRRFADATRAQIAAAANAIMGLDRGTPADRHGRTVSSACTTAGDGAGGGVAPALPNRQA